MRALLLSLLSCFTVIHVKSQPMTIDSINTTLYKTGNDTLRLVLFNRLGDAYMEVNIDSALYCARQYLQLSQKLNYKLNEADALQQMAEYMIELGSSGNALELSYKALQLLEDNLEGKNVLPPQWLGMMHVSKTLYVYPEYRLYIVGKVNNIIGMTFSMNLDSKALPYVKKALEISKSLPAEDLSIIAYGVLAIFKSPDSALVYLKKSYRSAIQTGNKKRIPELWGGMIDCYHRLGDHISELNYLRAALKFSIEEERLLRVGYGYLVLADYFYRETKTKDSVIFFGMKALQLAYSTHSPYLEQNACYVLSEMYKSENKPDSALKYLELKVAASEKTSGQEKIREFQNADFSHQQQQSALAGAKKEYRNNIRTYGLIAGLCIFLVLIIILWLNNKQRQKAFALLQRQKGKTEQALQELKSTQSQLIQSEKMASLGELTAGIAHEIQNPLNFVNNFSEVNKELLAEMNEQIEKGNLSEAKIIAKDVVDNQEKINHHGKRADAIVKGMLQHSRASSGQKELTDINVLADEYLRLAFHGLRAKDKSFNATIKTDFDAAGKINIIPQDIGRVLVNLLNNAFYAVSAKASDLGKTLPDKLATADSRHEPTVWVSTKKINDKVLISVRDNGPGIPQKVLDKIFQPFFTTKPAGQGTGLGLSLAYDIVKAHGGEIKVNTHEGEFTEFVVHLPVY